MKAVILTGRYATDQEVFYPLYRLQEDDWHVDIVTHEDTEVQGYNGIRITPTLSIDSLFNMVQVENPDMVYAVRKPVLYDLLIIPGGAKAMEYVRRNLNFIQYIRDFPNTIGCICHGTQLLISAGRVKGKKISGYYSIRDDIENAGGIYDNCDLKGFVTDGNIVTSSHYKHLGSWMKEVLRVVHESV